MSGAEMAKNTMPTVKLEVEASCYGAGSLHMEWSHVLENSSDESVAIYQNVENKMRMDLLAGQPTKQKMQNNA